MPTFEALVECLSSLAADSRNQAFSDKENAVIATDLEGISESSEKLSALLNRLVQSHTTSDSFDDLLVEIEVQYDHLTWHWKSLREWRASKDDSASRS
jgi:hypothetical protein